MKIIRWFFSHFFLILLIVTVIYGYMFWGNLAGKNTPAGKALAYLSHEFVEVEEFINAVKAKQAQLSAGSDESIEQEQAADDKQIAALSDKDETVAVERNITQQPVSISYSYNQMRVKQNSDGEIESQVEMPPSTGVATSSTQDGQQPSKQDGQIAEPAPIITPDEIAENDAQPLTKSPPPAVASMANAQDEFVSPEVTQQLDSVDKNGHVISQLSQGDAIRESWITARKSFYQRKYELSEQSYQDVISNTTDNFDAYGELGNVYFNQGKKQAAAAAYFEAASILLRKGQIRRASSLMGLLRQLDNNKANDLQKLIDSSAS